MRDHVKVRVHRLREVLDQAGTAERQEVYDLLFPEGRPLERRSAAVSAVIGSHSLVNRRDDG